MEQLPTTCPTATASSPCPARPAPHGTGSTSTPCTWTPTGTCSSTPGPPGRPSRSTGAPAPPSGSWEGSRGSFEEVGRSGPDPGQSPGEIFAWQHDPEAVGNDEYTFFDNDPRAPCCSLQPGSDRAAEPPGPGGHTGLLGRAARGAVGRRHRATPRPSATVTSWSAGAASPTSRSSADRGSSSSTPSSRRGEHLPGLPPAVERGPRMVGPGQAHSGHSDHAAPRHNRVTGHRHAHNGVGSVAPGWPRPTSPTAR